MVTELTQCFRHVYYNSGRPTVPWKEIYFFLQYIAEELSIARCFFIFVFLPCRPVLQLIGPGVGI